MERKIKGGHVRVVGEKDKDSVWRHYPREINLEVYGYVVMVWKTVHAGVGVVLWKGQGTSMLDNPSRTPSLTRVEDVIEQKESPAMRVGSELVKIDRWGSRPGMGEPKYIKSYNISSSASERNLVPGYTQLIKLSVSRQCAGSHKTINHRRYGSRWGNFVELWLILGWGRK